MEEERVRRRAEEMKVSFVNFFIDGTYFTGQVFAKKSKNLTGKRLMGAFNWSSIF
ncbi:MAG: hypothetical protein ACOCUK_00515 [bacterium]